MAAAARQTMPAEVAPPRSTTSPKLIGNPRYSDSVAGTKIDDSAIPLVTSPLTDRGCNPASSMALFASRAHCSSVNMGGRVGLRSGASSTKPTMAASPRSPTRTPPSRRSGSSCVVAPSRPASLLGQHDYSASARSGGVRRRGSRRPGTPGRSWSTCWPRPSAWRTSNAEAIPCTARLAVA